MSIIILVVFVVVMCFGIAILRGAPYLPTFNRDIEEIISKCGLKAGDKLLDLGSGDGRVLVIAARRGIRVVGYEINPIMWLISLIRIWPYRNIAKVRLKNMWRADVSGTDVVFVFLLDRLMGEMEAKLSSELNKGAKVASYVFKLPNRKATIKTRNAYIYKF